MRCGAGVDIESLPIIGSDETVHDTPDLAEPEVLDEPPSSLNLQVQSEEDIVGESAAIVYEKSLQQLTRFLQFPIDSCTWGDPELNQPCNAVPPFECKIRKRGTAYILEWVRLLPFKAKISSYIYFFANVSKLSV